MICAIQMCQRVEMVSNIQPKNDYLDLKLVALSTTYTTKLPPVLAHPVYHPHVKAKPFGCSASLRSLDMGWCVEPGPHRKGTRSRRCGRRLTEKQGGEAHVQQEGHVGTAPATPADLFRADHTLSPERP
jgi:hypothetical protein